MATSSVRELSEHPFVNGSVDLRRVALTSMRIGGTAGGRPVTSSSSPTGARKAAPRPGP